MPQKSLWMVRLFCWRDLNWTFYTEPLLDFCNVAGDGFIITTGKPQKSIFFLVVRPFSQFSRKALVPVKSYLLPNVRKKMFFLSNVLTTHPESVVCIFSLCVYYIINIDKKPSKFMLPSSLYLFFFLMKTFLFSLSGLPGLEELVLSGKCESIWIFFRSQTLLLTAILFFLDFKCLNRVKPVLKFITSTARINIYI